MRALLPVVLAALFGLLTSHASPHRDGKPFASQHSDTVFATRIERVAIRSANLPPRDATGSDQPHITNARSQTDNRHATPTPAAPTRGHTASTWLDRRTDHPRAPPTLV